MSSAVPSILLSPYTLLEEEALSWALLFSERVLFLHPFPLDLPETCRPLLDRGMIQVLTPSRTPEEIREKDRRIREFRTFAAQNPDFSFLEYLKQAAPAEPLETRDEILEQLRGGSPGSGRVESSSKGAAGEMLLCLIHDWLSQQWEIDRSLDRVAGQEKALAGIMEAGFEFSGDWTIPGSAFVAPAEAELVCPPALEAWKKLKEELAPGAPLGLTTQKWVWRERYLLDPEDDATRSISLPGRLVRSIESFAEDLQSGSATGTLQRLRTIFRELAQGSQPFRPLAEDLQIALRDLSPPEPGRYALVPPPPDNPGSETKCPLFLLLSTRAT
jgi:hypothetical protein